MAAFPPSEYLADELAARGWSVTDLCDRSGLPADRVADLLAGGRVSGADAAGLRRAFGTSAELWVNLDAAGRVDRHDSNIPREYRAVNRAGGR